MKKSRFTNEQIAFALRQAESGTAIEEVCRKLSISQQAFYHCRKKFGGMRVEVTCPPGWHHSLSDDLPVLRRRQGCHWSW